MKYIPWYCLFLLCICSACNETKKEIIKSDTDYVKIDYDKKLRELQIELPIIGTPSASFVHAVQSGNLLFLAGKGPRDAEGEIVKGKLGRDLTIEQGYAAAELVALSQLSVIKSHLGDLNRVARIVKVHGMVNCTEDFSDQSKVINGFSDMMVKVFGEKGKHARAAVGMASLPANMAVEIEVIVEVTEE